MYTQIFLLDDKKNWALVGMLEADKGKTSLAQKICGRAVRRMKDITKR